jgi:ParB-like nuclease domain
MINVENHLGPTDPERYGAPRLAVRYEPVAALRLDPQNPRLHNRKQVRQIANSIASFGFNVPVLVDAEQSVIAGHGRVLAAKELGWDEVPVIALEHLDAAQRRAFAIADNRLTENSAWDDRLLAEQLKELSLLDLSFDLEATGFDIGEIDLQIEILDNKPELPVPADQVPEVQQQAVSQIGDLWQLGRHRLFCGNALDRGSFAALMGGKKADLVFSDPPSNVPIEGHASGLGAMCHREFPMASGEMTEPEFTRFLAATFRQLCAFSREGSVHFICMDWRHLRELLAAADESYGKLLNLCVWVKTNGGMGFLYRSQHELTRCSRMARRRIATISRSAATAATAPMSGPILGSPASGARARKAFF